MELKNLSKANVLIVGDIMLDQYWLGDSARISPEAPVPVVNINYMESRLGGAANVAMNVSSLGANATLVGICGDDDHASKLLDLLSNTSIRTQIKNNRNLNTLTKLRIVSRNQQLIRLDFDNNNYMIEANHIFDLYKKLIPEHDAIIISDYGKGTVHLVSGLINLAREFNKLVIVDPKGLDFEKYQNASVLTPNYSEFINIVGACVSEEEFEIKASQLCKDLNLEALLITRSEKGMSLFSCDEAPCHFPTQAKEVYDVTGAGDTVVGLVAAALSAQYSLKDAVKIANLGAGVAVSKFGTVSVTVEQLESALTSLTGKGKFVKNIDELKKKLSVARDYNEKIVFTNGCFDLLHNGHIACLRDAKSKGDRLIVAINDDQSIKKLKGDNRPICTIQNRIAVLEELSSIDWIISFSEDTPINLIKELQPDVYVKGGDYVKEDLEEYPLVSSYGGEVYLSPYVEGCSTTSIIESILSS